MTNDEVFLHVTTHIDSSNCMLYKHAPIIATCTIILRECYQISGISPAASGTPGQAVISLRQYRKIRDGWQLCRSGMHGGVLQHCNALF